MILKSKSMSTELTKNRILEIAALCADLVAKFRAETNYRAADLLPSHEFASPARGIPILQLFASCCLPHGWKLRLFPWKTSVLALRGYASRLFRVSEKHFCLVVDLSSIQQTIIAPESTDSLLIKLFLHELGYLVLHSKALSSDLRAVGFLESSDAGEAWFFAGVIYGLAIADAATESARRNVPDTAWRFV